jgi:hypothetical protein
MRWMLDNNDFLDWAVNRLYCTYLIAFYEARGMSRRVYIAPGPRLGSLDFCHSWGWRQSRVCSMEDATLGQ